MYLCRCAEWECLCVCVCVGVCGREGTVQIARDACNFPNMATRLYSALSTFHAPDSTLTDVITAAINTLGINKQPLCGIQVSEDRRRLCTAGSAEIWCIQQTSVSVRKCKFLLSKSQIILTPITVTSRLPCLLMFLSRLCLFLLLKAALLWSDAESWVKIWYLILDFAAKFWHLCSTFEKISEYQDIYCALHLSLKIFQYY